MSYEEDRSMSAQAGVFDAALSVYRARWEVYGDAWKEHPRADTIMHIESKVARVKAAIARGQDDKAVSDALDCLNYLGFLVRRLSGPGEIIDGI